MVDEIKKDTGKVLKGFSIRIDQFQKIQLLRRYNWSKIVRDVLDKEIQNVESGIYDKEEYMTN